jgi:hypothetical protein
VVVVTCHQARVQTKSAMAAVVANAPAVPTMISLTLTCGSVIMASIVLTLGTSSAASVVAVERAYTEHATAGAR